ncbi:hypothetical protein B0T24DRAFT_178818 [Lasiosphaeria ovina]|uniref:Uncharacterized protein n=1 Tax=Lasiosphaeria ovina TaxID=92902 RepID=A0AAE0TU18_9PEZI|nr:hypothetical protein B0T24DRAFT_178818 [Lasiosphaeria ovina]
MSYRIQNGRTLTKIHTQLSVIPSHLNNTTAAAKGARRKYRAVLRYIVCFFCCFHILTPAHRFRMARRKVKPTRSVKSISLRQVRFETSRSMQSTSAKAQGRDQPGKGRMVARPEQTYYHAYLVYMPTFLLPGRHCTEDRYRFIARWQITSSHNLYWSNCPTAQRAESSRSSSLSYQPQRELQAKLGIEGLLGLGSTAEGNGCQCDALPQLSKAARGSSPYPASSTKPASPA